MDIRKIKDVEINEIYDFLQHIEDYGHIFYQDPSELDIPFTKIMEGIESVKKLIDESYGR